VKKLITQLNCSDKSPANLSRAPFHIAGDSEKKFRINKKVQPSSWMYNQRSIGYTTNSLGFRSKNFHQIKWNESIVALGCSNTFGIGVDDDDTWCEVLSKRMNLPVINLGVPAASIEQICLMSTVLKKLITPLAVIYCWPPVDRYAEFKMPLDNNKKDFMNPSSWSNVLPNQRMKKYVFQVDWAAKNLVNIEKDRLIWNTSIPRVECSYFDIPGIEKLDIVDTARDLEHPGILSHTQTAQHLHRVLAPLLT